MPANNKNYQLYSVLWFKFCFLFPPQDQWSKTTQFFLFYSSASNFMTPVTNFHWTPEIGNIRSFRWSTNASMLPSISYVDNWKQFDHHSSSKDLLYQRGDSSLSSGSSSEIDRLSMARTNTSSKISLRNWPNSSEFIRWNRIQNVKNRLATWRAVTMVSSVTLSPSLKLLFLLDTYFNPYSFIHLCSIPPADATQILLKNVAPFWISKILLKWFQSQRDYFKNGKGKDDSKRRKRFMRISER